jgi:hypothetical protein
MGEKRMKLRWFQYCDKYGMKSGWDLQYWDEDQERWVDVKYVECKKEDIEEYLSDPDVV